MLSFNNFAANVSTVGSMFQCSIIFLGNPLIKKLNFCFIALLDAHNLGAKCKIAIFNVTAESLVACDKILEYFTERILWFFVWYSLGYKSQKIVYQVVCFVDRL